MDLTVNMHNGIYPCNMVLPLSEFTWEVPADGFAVAVVEPDSVIRPDFIMSRDRYARAEWPTADAATEGLTRVLIPRTPAPAKQYRPLLEQPGLFRRFTELDENEAAVVEFASRFGSLHGKDLVVVAPWHHDKELVLSDEFTDYAPWKSEGFVSGTSPSWKFQVGRLRRVVNLHEVVTAGRADEFHKLVSWLKSPGTPGKLLARLEGGFPVAVPTKDPWHEAAKSIRDAEITAGLGARSRGEPTVRLRMVSGELQSVPFNLLGAMWLQFAVAVQEGKQFRRCPARGCPVVWFEVSKGPLGLRKDAEFCSDRCRHTAYRDRKNSAKQMHSAGKPLREIAKALGVASAQVRSWVGRG